MHMWPAAAWPAVHPSHNLTSVHGSQLQHRDNLERRRCAARHAQAAERSTHHLAFLWCSHCTLSLLLSTVSTQVNLLPGQVPGLRHASS